MKSLLAKKQMIMIRSIIGLVFFVSLCPSVAWGKEIIVLFTQTIKAYQEVAKGVEYSVKSKSFAGKKIFNDTFVYLTPKTANMAKDALLSSIVEKHPILIVAIGTAALDLASQIDSTPIVYTMVPNAGPIIEGKKNITGIDADVNVNTALDLIRKELPRVNRIGIIYNPEYNQTRVDGILAAQNGLKITALSASATNEVFPLLTSMSKDIDALWLIPDLTVISPRTVEAFVHFSIDNRIPLITFNENLLKYGATLAIMPKAYDVGLETGDLVAEILMGADISILPPRTTQQATSLINRKIFKKIVSGD